MSSEVGKTEAVGWQIGVSKTVAHPIAEVWDLVSSRRGLEIWLGPGVELPKERGGKYETATGTRGEVRSYRPLDRIRLTWQPEDWDHDSTLQVALSSVGSKTTLRFHQEWLADADERANQREHWREVVERLVLALTER